MTLKLRETVFKSRSQIGKTVLLSRSQIGENSLIIQVSNWENSFTIQVSNWGKQFYYPGLKLGKTSKCVKFYPPSPREQVLLIDRRWTHLGKGVCELYIKVYLPIKFHADILCSHWDMFHTKFKYEKTKGNNSTIRKWRVMVLVQYTSTH